MKKLFSSILILCLTVVMFSGCGKSVGTHIIDQTDAFSTGLTVVDTATDKMCGRVIYPAAVMKASKNPHLAQEFLEFLKTAKAGGVFKKVGFTPVAFK